MKISQLAKKFNIPTNTIRYYMSIGLLVPNSKTKQYDFTERDVKDLELILKLKNFMFSIHQIQQILSLSRISNFEDKGDVKDYIKLLEEQKDYLTQQQKNMGKIINDINTEIKDSMAIANKPSTISGVPLAFLQYLYCPNCHQLLDLDDAFIQKQQVISGKLNCGCGYNANIKNGIVITHGGYISEYDSPDLDRGFYKGMNPSTVSLFQKAYNWMAERLEPIDIKQKIIMETHINAYFFLYTNFRLFDPNALYIIVDKYPEIVAMYKEKIEHLNPNLKVLYIADSSLHYPIQDGCVDIYLDFFSINEFSIFNKANLLDRLKPYFHQDTKLIGTYIYFEPNAKSQQKLSTEYPGNWENNMKKEYFSAYLPQAGYKIIQEEDVGYTKESGTNIAFTFHVHGEKMGFYCYYCNNEPNNQKPA